MIEDKGLGWSDAKHGINVIFLVETWEYDAKCIHKIDDYLKSNRYSCLILKERYGRARITCICYEKLDNYVRLCKYDDIRNAYG